MANEHSNYPPVFRIDVSADPSEFHASQGDAGLAMVAMMRHLVALQERQNQMLEQIVAFNAAQQKQRHGELQEWKNANPNLSRACRQAAEALAKIQTQFIESLTDEIAVNEESMTDSDFMLNDFVDRFGPRFVHLNGILQMLAQLGSQPQPQQS